MQQPRGNNQLFKPSVKKVLCVGMACVDIINIVNEFPKEDSDQRIQDYYWQRGGNASNNCTVLSLLSVLCEFMGVLGKEGVEARWILNDFNECNVDISHCILKDVQCPIATIILSQKNGSRTIMFFPRDRPELLYDEFQLKFEKDFSLYSWIHFELCINVIEISLMIDDVLSYRQQMSTNDQPIISIEVEKPEFQNYGTVMNKADIVFVSKDYALSKGFTHATDAVKGLYSSCKQRAILICAWADQGAALCVDNNIITAPALSDATIKDTLGAGDTFVAGFIGNLYKQRLSLTDCQSPNFDSKKNILECALKQACYLAGLKCSMYGYEDLRFIMKT